VGSMPISKDDRLQAAIRLRLTLADKYPKPEEWQFYYARTEEHLWLLTVESLKEYLRYYNLKISGNKAALIARLVYQFNHEKEALKNHPSVHTIQHHAITTKKLLHGFLATSTTMPTFQPPNPLKPINKFPSTHSCNTTKASYPTSSNAQSEPVAAAKTNSSIYYEPDRNAKKSVQTFKNVGTSWTQFLKPQTVKKRLHRYLQCYLDKRSIWLVGSCKLNGESIHRRTIPELDNYQKEVVRILQGFYCVLTECSGTCPLSKLELDRLDEGLRLCYESWAKMTRYEKDSIRIGGNGGLNFERKLKRNVKALQLRTKFGYRFYGTVWDHFHAVWVVFLLMAVYHLDKELNKANVYRYIKNYHECVERLPFLQNGVFPNRALLRKYHEYQLRFQPSVYTWMHTKVDNRLVDYYHRNKHAWNVKRRQQEREDENRIRTTISFQAMKKKRKRAEWKVDRWNQTKKKKTKKAKKIKKAKNVTTKLNTIKSIEKYRPNDHSNSSNTSHTISTTKTKSTTNKYNTNGTSPRIQRIIAVDSKSPDGTLSTSKINTASNSDSASKKKATLATKRSRINAESSSSIQKQKAKNKKKKRPPHYSSDEECFERPTSRPPLPYRNRWARYFLLDHWFVSQGLINTTWTLYRKNERLWKRLDSVMPKPWIYEEYPDVDKDYLHHNDASLPATDSESSDEEFEDTDSEDEFVESEDSSEDDSEDESEDEAKDKGKGEGSDSEESEDDEDGSSVVWGNWGLDSSEDDY